MKQVSGAKIKNRFRAVGLMWAALGVVYFSGCVALCGIPDPPKGVGGAHELARLVVSEAPVVVYAPRFDELLEAMEEVAARVPLDLPEVGSATKWREAGAKIDGPGAAYWAQGQWVVVAWVDPDLGADVEEAWASEVEREAVNFGVFRGRGWREVNDEGRWTRWLSTDKRRLAAGFSSDVAAESLMQKIWQLEEEHRAVRAEKVDFVQTVGGGEGGLHGVIDAGGLVRQMGGEGQAAVLRDELARQIGEVYWVASPGEEAGELVVELRTPGDGETAFVGDLGAARGELPDIGGLARPGVPALLRLSADPQNLLPLIKSALAVEDRKRLEETLSTLKEELSVDVEADFIDNITGQFALVVFGLEAKFFEEEGVSLMSSLLRLQSTREALLVPFEDRRRMEDLFNVMTQISRGSLRRQAIRHTVQYAWFDDGSLAWAVILSDDHLLFVDSSVAFGYAAAWERGPTPLSGVFADRGVGEMMDSTRGVAAYLDLATLRGVISEGEKQEMARWLEGFDAVSFQTDVDGVAEHSRLRFWMSERE